MTNTYEPWTLPSELESYRSFLQDEDYPPIEELMTAYLNDPNFYTEDTYKALQAIAVSAKIRLLLDLHHTRMLRDLSAWVCHTPYPESGKFCGGPLEHPVFWGCGYEKLD